MCYIQYMTESDIYQLVGKAYCDGYQEALEKQAAFEKQALSPKLLLNAANKALSLGKGKQAINLFGGAKGRNVGRILSSLGTNAENVASTIPSVAKRDSAQIADWLLRGGHKGYAPDTVARVFNAGKQIPEQFKHIDTGIHNYMDHFGGGFLNTYKPVRVPQQITPLTL